jgi:hypothetical protein
MLKHNKPFQEIIYRYYPVEISSSDLKYGETEQAQNRWNKIEQLRDDTAKFHKLLDKLKLQVNPTAMERAIQLSYVGEFSLPRRIGYVKLETCVFIISGIVNLFTVYLRSDFTRQNTIEGVHSQEELDIVNCVSKVIKEVYPDYEPFPMDFFHTRVPGVDASLRYNDYATYFECLMSENIY